MSRIVLPTTDIKTFAVGLGTGGLASAGSERAAVRLLEVAFEAGVTHFDTAPLYGRGQVATGEDEFRIEPP